MAARRTNRAPGRIVVRSQRVVRTSDSSSAWRLVLESFRRPSSANFSFFAVTTQCTRLRSPYRLRDAIDIKPPKGALRSVPREELGMEESARSTVPSTPVYPAAKNRHSHRRHRCDRRARPADRPSLDGPQKPLLLHGRREVKAAGTQDQHLGRPGDDILPARCDRIRCRPP